MGDAVHPSVFVVGAALAAVILGPCRSAGPWSDEPAAPLPSLETAGSLRPDRTPLSLFADHASRSAPTEWPVETAERGLADARESDVIDEPLHGPGITPEPTWRRLSGERLGGGRRGIELLVAVDRATFGPEQRPLHVTGLRRSRALLALPILRDAVGLYPDGVLEKAGIRRIVVVGGLKRGEVKIGGVALTVSGTLIVKPARCRIGTETVLHHEVGHFLDHATAARKDPEWAALNPPGFQYGEQPVDSLRLTTRTPGFLSAYATKHSQEDKAELHRWLVTAPGAVAGVAPSDPYLEAKMALLGSRLEALDDRLDPEWWRKAWTQQQADRAHGIPPARLVR